MKNFTAVEGQGDSIKSQEQDDIYLFPAQFEPHEATWLQWPHKYTFGESYRQKFQPIFIQIAEALQTGEIVRIIAYNNEEKARISKILKNNNNIQYFIHETDDVWMRDNGPIFVRNQRTGQLCITHWGFNGWGGKTKYSKCCTIPRKISQDLGLKLIDLTDKMITQGGAYMADGQGTVLCPRSSILNDNRNPNLSEQDAEKMLRKYYGAKKVIWLDGVKGKDITDGHPDVYIRFVNPTTALTMNEHDLKDTQYIEGENKDIVYSVTNHQNIPYKIHKIPATKNVVQVHQERVLKQDLKHGSYLNFYIGNKVVLVPIYADPNDEIALEMISQFFPGRKVVGIQVNQLYGQGGMLHCITQQQPVRKI